MKRMLGVIMVAALLAGCSTLTQPPAADDAQAQAAIASAGDAGAIGCLVLAVQRPGDVGKARLAVDAAQTVLADPVPSFNALTVALDLGLPTEQAALAAIVLQRIKLRLGEADVLPSESVAWRMAEAFVSSCGEALAAVGPIET